MNSLPWPSPALDSPRPSPPRERSSACCTCVDYKRVVWLPHSLTVALAWVLIAIGFSRMSRAFQA